MWKTTALSLRPLVSVLAISLAWCTAPSVAGDKDGGKHEGRPIPCADLRDLKVPQTTIASAEIVKTWFLDSSATPEQARLFGCFSPRGCITAAAARYIGSGSIDAAANFEGRTPDHHRSKDR